MTETLPAIDPPEGRTVERLDRSRLEQDERVTELFRRSPGLTKAEQSELRHLWGLHIAERRGRLRPSPPSSR